MPLSILILVLLVTLAVPLVVAQEPAMSEDGRPLDATAGPVAAPTGEPQMPADTGESDFDEPGVSPQGDISTQDQVIADDLIVTGSECVGFDCANGESFGFDTLRLKENNLRIAFVDTSTGTFPTTDWEITANDSASGGASYLAFTDRDTGRVPFKVMAGTRTNALYVNNYSIGIGTASPTSHAVHFAVGDTPTIRFDQDGTWGWSKYVWDVAANEANFFVRDVNAGSTMPLRIFPGALTNSVVIGGADRGSSAGLVGLGTSSPAAALHVARSDSSWRPAQVLIEEPQSITTTERVMLKAINRGTVQAYFADAANSAAWQLGFGADGVRADFVDTETGVESEAFYLEADGNLRIAGALSEMSDVNRKENFGAVDGATVLSRLAEVRVTTWNYKGDAAKHVGPMAQDFHAAFAVGEDELHIAPLDANGVALAAIQELYRQVQAQNARIEALERENAALRAERGAR